MIPTNVLITSMDNNFFPFLYLFLSTNNVKKKDTEVGYVCANLNTGQRYKT